MRICNLLFPDFKSSNVHSAVTTNKYYSENKISSDCYMSKTDKYTAGDYIPYLGTVIAYFDILNLKLKTKEKCLLLYQKDDICGSYKLIKNDKNKIQKLSQFLKNEKEIYNFYKLYSYSFPPALLQKIQRNQSDMNDNINDLLIAEINYTKLDNKAIEKLNHLGYSKIDKEKDIICIQNFINYKKEYKYASRFVSVPLLKNLLNENKNIIIKASAFGDNPVSPINLYLRYGFMPLDAKIEDIQKEKFKTSKGKRINPETTVIMYLPKNAILHKLIQKVSVKPEQSDKNPFVLN